MSDTLQDQEPHVNASDDAMPTDAPSGNATQQSEATDRNETSPHMVPVAESIRYRKRAQAAEQELETLRSQLNDSHAELTQLRDTVSVMERRQKIDALLTDADAVDFEVARLLTEAAVEAMDEPDVHLAIDELRRSKPYLFRSPRGVAGAMGVRRYDPHEQAEQAADAAARSGDRRDLLHYLRLRRNGHAQSA